MGAGFWEWGQTVGAVGGQAMEGFQSRLGKHAAIAWPCSQSQIYQTNTSVQTATKQNHPSFFLRLLCSPFCCFESVGPIKGPHASFLTLWSHPKANRGHEGGAEGRSQAAVPSLGSCAPRCLTLPCCSVLSYAEWQPRKPSSG